MTLRPYADTDLRAIVALFTASVHDLAAGQYDAEQCEAWAPRAPDLQHWQQRLQVLNVMIAEAGSELAGFIGYGSNGHIDLLFTAPAAARSGVATALYRHAEQQLRDLSIHELWTEASLLAKPFFAHHGFIVEAEQTVQRNGVSLRRFAMRRKIS